MQRIARSDHHKSELDTSQRHKAHPRNGGIISLVGNESVPMVSPQSFHQDQRIILQPLPDLDTVLKFNPYDFTTTSSEESAQIRFEPCRPLLCKRVSRLLLTALCEHRYGVAGAHHIERNPNCVPQRAERFLGSWAAGTFISRWPLDGPARFRLPNLARYPSR
ncbi:hypothetical protein DAEQUDRAFT_584460 [Daedalea quercina L-15889]|uniref:Uncharacterized protein n=1 Tax=Daedalea quercina L-15889 TaxID=1314783 RepID=A0A165LQD8_9APHY|nr:hypothetical protein DAEQUDRAFT_584460 [Daedalea quercina L-15889]